MVEGRKEGRKETTVALKPNNTFKIHCSLKELVTRICNQRCSRGHFEEGARRSAVSQCMLDQDTWTVREEEEEEEEEFGFDTLLYHYPKESQSG